MPVIPALKRLRQKNLKFETNLRYLVRPLDEKPNKNIIKSNGIGLGLKSRGLCKQQAAP